MQLHWTKFALMLLVPMAGRSVALDDAFELGNNPCASVRTAGVICADCGTLGFCLKENGAWKTIDVAHCVTDNNYFCDESSASCTFQKKCTAPVRTVQFECQMAGIYPDPYNCRSFHECTSNGGHTRRMCYNNEVYLVAKQKCGAPMNGSECHKQYCCNSVGDRGAWPENPNIYYVCYTKKIGNDKVIYPVLYKCADGKVFDGAGCVIDTSNNQQPSVKPSQPPQQDTVCTTSRLLPNPADCHGYMKCSGGKFNYYTCPSGTRFNEGNSACVIGTC